MAWLYNRDFLECPEFPFHVSKCFIPNNGAVLPHSHEFFELVYIAEGIGEHHYKDSTYLISEGDLFIVEPGAEHAYQVVLGSHLLVYNVLLDSSFLFSQLDMLSNEPVLRDWIDLPANFTLDLLERIEIKHLLVRMEKEFNEKKPGYRALIKSRLIELFIFLSRCSARLLQKPVSAVAEEKMVLERVCEFIELYYASPISLAEVSQLCGLSLSSFTAKFKQHVGKTFIEYRNEVRIRIAKELLRKTDDKILHISQEVGFEDLSFFNKMFKQMVGISPGKYREQAKREECANLKISIFSQP